MDAATCYTECLALETLGLVLFKEGQASAPEKSYSLEGELYAARSGWILLSVPNALAYGAFKALREPGVEWPPGKDGAPYQAHISVMRPEELESLGGVSKITERGKRFKYTLGPLQTVEPHGWDEMNRVWMIQVESPELKNLRKSYGLTPLPNENKFAFHITIAVRKKGVLKPNELSKAAADAAIADNSKDLSPGGKADHQPDSKFPAAALQQGQAVEQEHTDNLQLAKEIAKDHLTESPRYYTELKKMEAKLEKESADQEALQLLLDPLIRSWMNQQGLIYGGGGSQNLADQLLEQHRQDEGWQAMGQAAQADRPLYEQLLGRLVGENPTPEQQQAIRSASGHIADVAPAMMTIAPGLWDQLHGQPGSAAALARGIYDGGRFLPDPHTGELGLSGSSAAGLAAGIHPRLQNTHGFSAGQLGELYASLAREGLIGSDLQPDAAADRLQAYAEPAAVLRDSGSELSPEGGDSRQIAALLGGLRDFGLGEFEPQEVARRAGQARAMAEQGPRYHIDEPAWGQVDPETAAQQDQQLRQSAAQSPYLNWRAMQARFGDQADDPSIQRMGMSSPYTNAEFMTPELVDEGRSAQWDWYQNRASQLQPLLRDRYAAKHGYHNWAHLEQLHKPYAAGEVQQARSEAGELAQQRAESGYTTHQPIRRIAETLRTPSGDLGQDVGRMFGGIPAPAGASG